KRRGRFSSAGPRSSNRWRGQVLRSAQMLPWLKAIVDWIFGRHSSLIQLSLQALNASGMSSNRRSGPDPPTRPHDPERPMRVPRRDGPTGRSASVAVAEPGDDENLMAIGSRIGDRPGVLRRSSDEGLQAMDLAKPASPKLTAVERALELM